MTGRAAHLVVLLLLMASLVACSRGKDDEPATAELPAPSATPPLSADVALSTPAPAAEPSPTPTVSPTPAPAPVPTPTPGPRIVNGLQVVDEVWTGEVREAGGLRLRSAPRIEPGNVVGSVAEGTRVTVEGRVLNGQEAESGKGTVWLIVGPGQYLYAAPGYVERIR